MFITESEALKAYTSDKRHWQGIPAVERTKNGRLFVAFYSGGETEQMGNYVVLIVSDDGGAHFSEPVGVAYMGEDARAYDPCLWIDPLGRLQLFWGVMPDNRIEYVRCDCPDEENLQFSPVRTLGYDVMMNKPIVTRTGDWLYPCAVWRPGLVAGSAAGSDGRHPTGCHIFRSRDMGETYERVGTADVADRTYDEHMLLEKSNGDIHMYIRTRYGVALAKSTDGGETFEKSFDCGFGGPNSRFCIRRLSSGHVLLVNHYHFRGRNNLYAMLSLDDGETFVGHLLLDGRANVSYPDMKEGEDGFLYIVYDHERGAQYDPHVDYSAYAREILMAKVTEQDILAGRLLHEGSQLAMTVSRLGHRSKSAVGSGK